MPPVYLPESIAHAKHIKNRWFLPMLIAGLGLMLAHRMAAQVFTPLHSFAYGGTEGANPEGSLILSGGTLYGTASTGINPGGYSGIGNGTVFAVNINGTGFTNVYSFMADGSPYYTNSDGGTPEGSLILSGSTLYGTTSEGGTNGAGTVFAVNVNGSNYMTLHTFTGGTDGGGPYAGLILAGGTLYGTALYGGSNYGTVFALSTNGLVFANLHSFTNGTDGVAPLGNLILSGSTLYGTTSGGNSGGFGSVFAVNTNGTGFTNLHDFTANSGFPNYTNSDGSNPEAGLILAGNTLYGTASESGLHGSGAIFAVKTNGMGFTNLYNFTAMSGSPPTNNDGATPRGGLILAGGTLYGTTYNGGLYGSGTMFGISTNGTVITNLHVFTFNSVNPYTNSDGAHPNAGLLLAGNTLYGTATGGGNADSFTGAGTVFSFSLVPVITPPQLAIVRSGTNVVLSWPTNATGFTLEAATNLASPSAWSTNLPLPVVVGGQDVVTNGISGSRKFYRLSQ